MRKVLVLEDEDNIRSFVVLNLNRAGYDTLEADHWGGGAGRSYENIRRPALPYWT